MSTIPVDLEKALFKLEYYELIGPNKKACVKTYQTVDSKSYLGGIYRWYYGENRKLLVDDIDELITQVFHLMAIYKDRTLRELLISKLQKLLITLGHLMSVYSDDKYILAKLNIIKEKIYLLLNGRSTTNNAETSSADSTAINVNINGTNTGTSQ